MLYWHLLAQRAWSFTKHSCPPECYALALSDSEQTAISTCNAMKQHWANVLELEDNRHTVGIAQSLWYDILFTQQNPYRLTSLFYERDCFSHESAAGSHMLKGQLIVLPDNKVVEDEHNSIRRDAKANPNTNLLSMSSRITVTLSQLQRRSGRTLFSHSKVRTDRLCCFMSGTSSLTSRRPAHTC